MAPVGCARMDIRFWIERRCGALCDVTQYGIVRTAAEEALRQPGKRERHRAGTTDSKRRPRAKSLVIDRDLRSSGHYGEIAAPPTDLYED